MACRSICSPDFSEKRVDRAVEIAAKAGMPLRVAAKIDVHDEHYYRSEVAHLFELSFVDYMGEVTESQKGELLGGARALLFPIDWAEPFGLVMIEAMACGTPVVAWRAGSVPEIIEDGVTGFIVDNIEDAVQATRRAATLDRRRVRREFERRFTADRMAREYVELFEVMRGG
jgi:glycosyltransferase involved in cell wall biosynthesis